MKYLRFSLGNTESLPGQLFFKQSRIDKRNGLEWKSATGLHARSDTSHKSVCVSVVDDFGLAVIDCHVLIGIENEATTTAAHTRTCVSSTS